MAVDVKIQLSLCSMFMICCVKSWNSMVIVDSYRSLQLTIPSCISVNVADYSEATLACQTFLSVIGECSSGYQCTVEAGVPSCQ